MKEKKDTKKDAEELDSLLVRFKRLEISLADKIDKLIESQEKVSEHSKRLTLEIEELKKIKNSVVKAVDKAVEESLNQAFPKLLPPLVQGFEKKTNAFVDSSIQEAQRLKNEIDQTVSKATRLISSQKRETTIKRFGIGVAFYVSSLITTSIIFYFFPQHEYHNVHYAITPTMAKVITIGEAFIENAGNLTSRQKEFFMKKAEEKLYFHSKREGE